MKRYPWFVSDVTLWDLDWTLAQMAGIGQHVGDVATECQAFLKAGAWVAEAVSRKQSVIDCMQLSHPPPPLSRQHPFWTQPHDFAAMKVLPSLSLSHPPMS